MSSPDVDWKIVPYGCYSLSKTSYRVSRLLGLNPCRLANIKSDHRPVVGQPVQKHPSIKRHYTSTPCSVYLNYLCLHIPIYVYKLLSLLGVSAVCFFPDSLLYRRLKLLLPSPERHMIGHHGPGFLMRTHPQRVLLSKLYKHQVDRC